MINPLENPEITRRELGQSIVEYAALIGGVSILAASALGPVTNAISGVSEGAVDNTEEEPGVFTVTFINEGVVFNQQALRAGDTIVDPGIPTKEGLVFNGWSPEFVSGTTCTGDITFQAQFVLPEVYAMLYDDWTMVFQRGNEPEVGKTLFKSWTGFETESYDKYTIPWVYTRVYVTSVSFKDEIRPVSTACWFYGMENCTSMDLAKLDTSKVTNMDSMFYNCSKLTSLDVSGFDTSGVTNMNSMFYNCSGPTLLNVKGFDTSAATDMRCMFLGCSGLTSLDVSGFDTSRVTDMHGMFEGCSGLTSLPLSSFDTSGVTDMSWMFQDCSGLTSLDLGEFNTSSVTDMNYMFNGSLKLTALNVSRFDTKNVTNMCSMFRGCSGLTSLDVSLFNTASVTNMSLMFHYCSGLTFLDLSLFDTSRVGESMGSMFTGCAGLRTVKLGARGSYPGQLPGTTWKNSAGIQYSVYKIPNNVADTYTKVA